MKIFLPFVVLFVVFEASARDRALVYRGTGGCRNCAAAAATVVEDADMKVAFVSPSSLEKSDFEDAVVWVQPAGNGIDAAKALGKDGLELIRDFVRKGGAYLGFCAGAFLADKWVDDHKKVAGLGLLPFGTLDYDMGNKENAGMLWMNWNGKRRHVFFNGGGTFEITKGYASQVKVFATYPDGSPAAIEMTYGKGRVVLTGAHPEAPDQWKDDRSLEDEDGPDLDLAAGMLKRALKD